MFNRQPFNRGKFNTSSLQSLGANGIGLMVMKTNLVPGSRIINASGKSNLIMNGLMKGTNVKYNKGIADLYLGGSIDATKIFIADTDIANMLMTTLGNQNLTGESNIDLTGIILKPGDELVISTCDMTVTINGQNAMEYFSSDSDFFTLLNGLNTLEYRDSNSMRNISFDVIWKDRWL